MRFWPVASSDNKPSRLALAPRRGLEHMRSEKHCEKVRRGLYSPEASVQLALAKKNLPPLILTEAMVACRARLAKGAYLLSDSKIRSTTGRTSAVPQCFQPARLSFLNWLEFC